MEPTALLALSVLIGAGATVAGLLYVARASRRLAPEETGLVPVYTDRGGGIFGLLRISAPFVRIAVYESQVVIAHFSSYVLPVASIRQVSIARVLIGRRVQLFHDCASVPSPLLLWSNTADALAAAIRSVAPHAVTAG